MSSESDTAAEEEFCYSGTESICSRGVMIQSILANMSKIESRLVDIQSESVNYSIKRRFLESRLRYYERLLRETSGSSVVA